MNQPQLNPDAIRELTEAIRLTVEYVGTGMLPAIPGWSWYDAMVKYAPNDAEVLRAMDPLPEPAAALPEVTSVEELEALPNGSVILPLAYHTIVAVALRDQYGTWAVAGHPGDYSTEAIFLGMHGQPARVLHRPEVKP